jgi:N-formylglutamate amidohydrolase
MTPVEVRRGMSPVILGLPHTGTHVPPGIWVRLNQSGRLLADTDWHVHDLYNGLLSGVTTVQATFHRYVIDANRDPAGGSLYPGQNTMGLGPCTDFDGRSIWLAGRSQRVPASGSRSEGESLRAIGDARALSAPKVACSSLFANRGKASRNDCTQATDYKIS